MAAQSLRPCYAIANQSHRRQQQQSVHSRAQPSSSMAGGRWMQVALVALVVAVALHHHGVGASPNATVANGSVNGKLSERHSYNASASDDLITPDEINAGLLEYFAGPLPLAAMEAAKPKRANARPAAIYMNEFAVYIPRGADVADSIAHKYGFSNMGQIGPLKGYYLFHHNHVRKRSVDRSEAHHNALNTEPEVRWVQQQHEKPRFKRDYSTFDQDFVRFPGFRSLVSGTRMAYRDTSTHNIFPDPLFKEQWYLNGGAKDGPDMNVGPAWQKGYTGKGVVVSILDDGIQRNHPDLALNYDPAASYDINGNDSDPMPRDNGDNKHGTRCAGEVAAVAFNQYCGVGVAYNASIGGVRMLDGTVNDAVEAKALGLYPDHIDIYSASWGPEDDGSTVDGPGPLARRAFIFGVTSGRQGKGSIFIWASGNGGRYTDSCNCDGYTNSIFTLSISSATQGGYKPWYLEECSSTLATTYSSGTPGHDKSVATVDMDGSLRPDRICTVEHTGTSASAPLAAGIAALALEANPALTWRDMQYLVVLTSRSDPLEKEPGWILNGVKRKVSHKFGYGLMDAGAMVSLAEQWTTVPSQHICKSREINEDRPIEVSVGYTLQTHMDVNGCAGTVNEVRFLEHVQCKITLRFFPRGNLRILLTSPMGTTSTLLFERPRDITKSNFDDWPFLSVHFWGERAEGRWTLQILNGGPRRVSQPGILSKWQLIFYGTQTNPIRLKSEGTRTAGSAGYSGLNPFVFPTETDLNQQAGALGGAGAGYYQSADLYSNFMNYPNLFSGAGSGIDKTVATLNGHNIPTAQRENVMADSNNKLVVLHDCDPECDQQGCYGKGPTQCVACKHYRLDNTCVSRCPPRSFPNQGGVCWPCHESCETCAGAGQDSCLTCAPAHLYVTDLAVCLQVCPEGYYENYDNRTCVPCEANCASCQDRPDYCTSCDHHLVMHEHRCYAACPKNTYETEDYNCGVLPWENWIDCFDCFREEWLAGGGAITNLECPVWPSEYFENGHCHPCHSTCETCTGPTENECLTCASNLLLQGARCVNVCDEGYYMEVGVCAKCLHTCTQCVSRMNCTACMKGLQLQSGECRTTCADGYYSDRGTCAKCYLSCHTCSGPRRNQCVQCPEGWQLAGGECFPECPEGFFKTKFGCQRCHHYCKTCNGAGPLACTTCPAHSMLQNGLCIDCLASQYYDPPTQTCKTCHESCRTCSGPGQFSCLTCPFPLHLDRLNHQCVPCCAADASPDDQSCCHCDKATGGCINASPAGKRRIGAEQQLLQFGEESGAPAVPGDGGATTPGQAAGRAWQQFLTSTSTPTLMVVAVSGCLLIVTLFVVIFTVLQKRSQTMYTGIKYNKLGKKAASGRTTRISIPADGDDLLEPIVNNDEDEEEEEQNDDDDDDDEDESGQSGADGGEEERHQRRGGGGGRGARSDSRRSTAAMATAARGKRTFRYAPTAHRT
uniref:furin n=1 Tax=Anopheles gambiae TaxID=7165 RepID=A0A1S4GGJ0_ANOGA